MEKAEKIFLRDGGQCACGSQIIHVFSQSSKMPDGTIQDFPIYEFCPACDVPDGHNVSDYLREYEIVNE